MNDLIGVDVLTRKNVSNVPDAYPKKRSRKNACQEGLSSS